jgi:hypothetical protein
VRHSPSPAAVAELDQLKAHADQVTVRMARAFRADLAEGTDPIHLWYAFTNCFAREPSWQLAAALSSALLRMAQDVPQGMDPS